MTNVKKGLLVFICKICFILSIILYVIPDLGNLFSIIPAVNVNTQTLWIFFLVSGLAVTVLIYLQSGTPEEIKNDLDKIEKQRYREYRLLTNRIDSFASQLNHFDKQIQEFDSTIITDYKQKEILTDAVIDKVGTETIKKIFKDHASEYEDSLRSKLDQENINSRASEMKDRLLKEISDLGRRSNVSLVLGMTITIFGLYLLWDTVKLVDYTTSSAGNALHDGDQHFNLFKALLPSLIPRVMLVIFIEFFAYFFLSLYRKGLDEIKYFQNEMTNIESKILALNTAHLINNEKSIEKSLEEFSRTERNFVLENGQTTADVERVKVDYDIIKKLLDFVPASLVRK